MFAFVFEILLNKTQNLRTVEVIMHQQPQACGFILDGLLVNIYRLDGLCEKRERLGLPEGAVQHSTIEKPGQSSRPKEGSRKDKLSN